MANSENKEFQDFIKRLMKGASDVYFRDVIEISTGQKVLEVDGKYLEIVSKIKDFLNFKLKEISAIVERNYKGRANELGNFIEDVLIKYLRMIKGFSTKRTIGYPDIDLDANGEHIYIECKIYQTKTINSSLRTFYFKVSYKSGVKHTCPHILIGFEVKSLGGKNKSPFVVNSFKIVDLYELKVNLKPEFNASNPMVYKNCKNL